MGFTEACCEGMNLAELVLDRVQWNISALTVFVLQRVNIIDRNLLLAEETGEWLSLHTSHSGALSALDIAWRATGMWLEEKQDASTETAELLARL
jgi:hypothetical protein